MQHSTNCRDEKDLLGTVAELKQAHRKLSEQNSRLLRTVAQCEDVNLQLTLEVTDLRAKLARQMILHLFSNLHSIRLLPTFILFSYFCPAG